MPTALVRLLFLPTPANFTPSHIMPITTTPHPLEPINYSGAPRIPLVVLIGYLVVLLQMVTHNF
jgi:hypothetical protein